MRKLGLIWVSAVMVAMAAFVWSGCESAGGTGGIGISPSSVTLGGASSNATEAVVFTAQTSGTLALPLEWRVSNPALGTIISQSGSNATYKANSGAKGDNIITVRDQYQNEGSAVITQQ
ncbi:MAG: hypothetical protein WCO42_09745 [bacterium]